MKRLLLAALLACPLFGQSPTAAISTLPHFEHIVPSLVPTSPTDVWTRDVYLEAITLTNESSSTASACTVQDKQGTPRAYMKTVSLAANTTYNDQHVNGRYFPGGLTWSCTTGTVTGYLRVKR